MAQNAKDLQQQKACLLYDVENVGGGIGRAKSIRQLLDNRGILLRQVVLAGQGSQVKAIADAFLDCERLELRSCPPGKQIADVELATQAGISLSGALQDAKYDALLIASADKAVVHCGCSWIEAGLPVIVISKATENGICFPDKIQRLYYEVEKANKSRIRLEFQPEEYPFWFDSIPKGIDGLVVSALPTRREPIPQFIPLPLVLGEIKIGSNRGSCDVALDYWEDNNKIGLYSPHIFIGYSASGWYLRSAHGLRRGLRAVQLNERVISAQKGNCHLQGGDILRLGTMEFKFQCRDDNAFTVNPPSGESTHDHLKAIELWFHSEIAKVLNSVSADWWETMVPDKVKKSCVKNMENKHMPCVVENLYRHTFLLDLQDIILACWAHFVNHRIQVLWRSKNQLRKAFSALNETRNKEEHAPRLPPTEEEIAFIKRLSGDLFQE